jgi:hypothetical protein
MHKKVSVDVDVIAEFDPAIGHTASLGYAFVDRPPQTPPPSPPPPPDYKKCKTVFSS